MAAKHQEIRIVLLGKTGSGKSSSGNTILGREVFGEKNRADSVTTTCETHRGNGKGQAISVTDCPGLFDTSSNNERQQILIKQCLRMSVPGPHVFLLVIRLDEKFTEQEKNAVKWIQENFGENAVYYTVILFTHADALHGTSLERYIRKSKDLMNLIESCYFRYHSFNNEKRDNRDQVTKLLEEIEKMCILNEDKR